MKARHTVPLIVLFALLALGAPVRAGRAPEPSLLQDPTCGPDCQAETFHPQVIPADRLDTLPALAALPGSTPDQQLAGEPSPDRPRLTFPKVERAQPPASTGPDILLQSGGPAQPAAATMPAPRFNFAGLSNRNLVVPPDPIGAIGPEHYVQWVNLSLAIWRVDRDAGTASLVWGPAGGNSLWAGFGGACEFTNHGDPVVLYDHLAGRWLISQFSINGPYYQCIAISQSADPTGGWHRYAFKISDFKMNDYPKFGVWPDGYYLSINQFVGTLWAGAGAAVFERDKMLAGLPARMIYLDLYAVNSDFGGMLPADLDGPPPPAGTPNYFLEVDDASWIGPADALRLWAFHVDWNSPGLSTFGQTGNPTAILPVADFTPLCTLTSNCVPQPGGAPSLDAIPDRLMYPLQYRNFGTYATLVGNHTVDAGGGRAGLRWYELRSAGGAWGVYRQGTYAGDSADSLHRWMGSASLDKVGNLAIGYSASGLATYPSIRYAGRLAGDPPGSLAQGETVLVAGTGAQTSPSGRWGDYSMIAVDPVDDCTFWYTSEYYPATATTNWHTRIGAFALPACLAQATGSLEGRVRSTATGAGIAAARLALDGLETLTDAGGFYQFLNLPAGPYTLTVSAYGYPQTSAPVEVITNTTTTQDFNLAPIQPVMVSGVARDGSGQGWPLYARVQVEAGGLARTLYTDPFTGAYQVELPQGVAHTFTVNAVFPGYQPASRVVTPGPAGASEDFDLLVEAGPCQAAGYDPDGGCAPLPGGLLVGFVTDANTGAGLVGAEVAEQAAGSSATSLATPEDPQAPDGYFALFAPGESEHTFTASLDNYGSVAHTLTLPLAGAVRQDFALLAGQLVVEPPSLAVSLSNLRPYTYSITLRNTGGLTVTFSLQEIDAPAAATASGTFATLTRHISPKRIHDRTAAAVYEYAPPAAEALPYGRVLDTWPSGLAAPWGVGVDTRSGDLWLGALPNGGMAGYNARFLPDGRPAGDVLDLSSVAAVYLADLAFDPAAGKFWQVMVGGSNCVVEIDPTGPALTGRQICPGFDTPQRGLAYNPLDGTFYSGSWNNGILYHFDAAGRLLDTINTGINIAGLAFHPPSRRLFALSNADAGYDVYVLDTTQAYRLLGGFDLPGLDAYTQAGLELDCAGRLWAVSQATGAVIAADSGAGPACSWDDIPWLQVAPVSGSLPPGGEQLIQVTTGPQGWQSEVTPVHLLVNTDTPYGELRFPLEAVSRYELVFPGIIFK